MEITSFEIILTTAGFMVPATLGILVMAIGALDGRFGQANEIEERTSRRNGGVSYGNFDEA